ncbi:CDP-diacylglycerol--serine O-phosphatidyltransferase [Paenibacillus sp. FSL P2-0089]|uniref:CDP-diacylglycerol--serine O-phosphatidyltransferase n=1 Tax=Paenibacillus silagei TaxID=1670801 RepID=A0ABS4NM55_9BACL|nr:CDP-diacylglycerol--serine O-phosphatidyltransferase [Paenibacillus silagei]MBP2111150.1 CDP-diacylglycerol--serine O-phosphatidyltransferase [Paenibacillus silagei]OMG02098.1 CDP-diacylglycerol--serine O-phosphatidyltransferase [Paenibacillus sp. FSL R7-0333]
MKWSWLPSMCTLGNLGFGSISLLFTIEERYDLALLMILLAAICDVMDGLLARMLHCTSDFGKQLDSLADIISFGIAPAFLILLYRLENVQWVGPVAAVAFLICGALRLARFNISAPSKGFVGMPITAAGLLLSMTTLIGERLKPEMVILIMGLLSILMISRVPFPSFKKFGNRK